MSIYSPECLRTWSGIDLDRLRARHRQQVKGSLTLHEELLPALRDGTRHDHEFRIKHDDLHCAFYGALFRPPGDTLAPEARLGAMDANSEESALIDVWWRKAAAVDQRVQSPDAEILVRTPRMVNRAVRALSGSSFFAGASERVMIGSLRQVRRYFGEPAIRAAARAHVIESISADTRLVIGHSLGSVVAYEALAEAAITRWLTLCHARQ